MRIGYTPEQEELRRELRAYFTKLMTPERADQLLDDLAGGREVRSTRGATITSWREAERVLAGFPDGRADEGPTAGGPSILGLEIADAQGWKAPDAPPPLAAAKHPEEQAK